jgi:ABC-type transport system involved in multi-copper enzyme maturation permease subunit
MRQFITISKNAFMELVRQPVFLLLMTFSSGFSVFLAAVPYFGFGDDPKMVKDSILAVMLLSGLFGAVLSASASVAHEIRSGTALAVLAKPVGRTQFILAKYFGLVGALTLLSYVNMVSILSASRMVFDAYGNADTVGLGIFFGCLVVGYALGGFTNYFLRRPFVADAVFFVVLMVTVSFFIIGFINKDAELQAFAKGTDWRLVPAGMLILFALWILAGLALACSTRWEMIPTLAICSAIFLLGLMSDYLFGRWAVPAWETFSTQVDVKDPRWSPEQTALLGQMIEKYDLHKDGRLDPDERRQIAQEDKDRMIRAGLGAKWWARVLYTITPNWQLFWLADALDNQNPNQWMTVGPEPEHKTIPWQYVRQAFFYLVGYVGASLAAALLLFEDRELT